MRTAFKCRVYPSHEQEALLRQTFGCIRYVWNATLAYRHEMYATTGKSLSYPEASRYVTQLKKVPGNEFLNDVSAVALQQAIRHQEAAFARFFAKRARYPRFKTRNSRRSASFNRGGFSFRNGQIKPAKFAAPLKYVWTWPEIDPATLHPATITVSCDSSGRWFVSFSVEIEPPQLASTDTTIGLDLGLTDIVVTSRGEKIPHPRHMDKHEKRLKRYQRMMARKQKGSANREKARKKVAKQHAKVADARRDHLHKLTSKLVRENDTIAIEDLAPSNMIKNRCLSKAISRTGWFELRRQLEYKSERNDRKLVVIDRWYPSSKTCSECGHLLDKLNLKTRHWTCPGCGTRHDRDINAAKNILAAGLAVDVCGGDVRPAKATSGRPPAKQKTATRQSP